MAAICAAFLIGAISLPFAPRQEAQGPPRFRTSVQLVYVDVAVFDTDGLPVENLELSDFEILEDGRRVEPAFLRRTTSAIDSPNDVSAAAGDFTSVQFDNHDIPGGRVLALVLDTHQVGFRPRDAHRTRQFARGIVDGLGPHDYAAVITPGGRANQQSDFTRSKAQLRAAIDKFRPGAPSGGSTRAEQFEKAYRAVSSAEALTALVDVLASIEDRRKGIVIVSGGAPFTAIEPTQARNADAEDVRQALVEAADAARRANVPFHTFYPGVMQSPISDGQRGLAWLSERTGGIAAVNTNTLEPNIAAVLHETATHYLLGYYSSAPVDSAFHTIEVDVRRPDVRVMARRGFVSDPPQPLADLSAAIRFPLPLTNLPLKVVGVPVPAPGQEEAGVALGIEFGDEGSPEPRDHDVLIVVTDMRGNVEAERRLEVREASASLPPSQVRADRARAALQLLLEPGRYMIRVAARRLDDGAVGTALAQVDVPTFRGKLAMSGIGLTTGRASARPPSPEVHGLLESIPIPADDLAVGDELAAVVRLATRVRGPNGASSITFTTTLTDEQGGTRDVPRTSQPGAAFTAPGGAVHRIELPPLQAGRWRLSITASTAGVSETRTTTLVVR